MLRYYYAEIDMLEDAEKFNYWLNKMDRKRKEKVFQSKNKEDKRRTLMAGILLRHGLEKENLCYEELLFSNTPEGKPVLQTKIPVCFNLSHSGKYAVCIISDVPVGIDIERTNRAVFLKENRHFLNRMAKKCLSEKEWLLYQTSDEKAKCFTEYWTKKEAYSKYMGKGLALEFSKIDTESRKEDFWSAWLEEEYCVSIYREKRNYEEMVIEKCMMN